MKKLTLAITAESHKKLKVLAAQTEQTMVSILLECIDERYEEMDKDVVREVKKEIKKREKLQNEFEEFVTKLSVADRRKVPDDIWEIFDDKYKP